MAKWGEGDPRWIVEERPDATNVNNWHWTEKNASQWSDEKLRELLKGLVISTDTGDCEITDIKKIEGDAVVNNRKGKLIFFYEWDILLDWKGSMNDSDEQIEGQISIPNLSEENKINEVDVIVTLLNNSKEGYRVKEWLHGVAPIKIRQRLQTYVNLLREVTCNQNHEKEMRKLISYETGTLAQPSDVYSNEAGHAFNRTAVVAIYKASYCFMDVTFSKTVTLPSSVPLDTFLEMLFKLDKFFPEFSKGMILPRKGESDTINTITIKKDTTITTLASGFNKVHVNNKGESTVPAVPAKVPTVSFKMERVFKCTAEDLYRAMTDLPMVQCFTAARVKMDVREGGEFELFNGNILGTFVELVPNKKIVQRWRYKPWPAGHFSNVEIIIDQKEDHTEMRLSHTGVPARSETHTMENWDRCYWERIKKAFGFGAYLV